MPVAASNLATSASVSATATSGASSATCSALVGGASTDDVDPVGAICLRKSLLTSWSLLDVARTGSSAAGLAGKAVEAVGEAAGGSGAATVFALTGAFASTATGAVGARRCGLCGGAFIRLRGGNAGNGPGFDWIGIDKIAGDIGRNAQSGDDGSGQAGHRSARQGTRNRLSACNNSKANGFVRPFRAPGWGIGHDKTPTQTAPAQNRCRPQPDLLCAKTLRQQRVPDGHCDSPTKGSLGQKSGSRRKVKEGIMSQGGREPEEPSRCPSLSAATSLPVKTGRDWQLRRFRYSPADGETLAASVSLPFHGERCPAGQ